MTSWSWPLDRTTTIHQLQTSRIQEPKTFNRSGSQDVKISQSEQINGFMICCTTQWLQLQIHSSQKPQIELPIAVGLFLEMNAAMNNLPIHPPNWFFNWFTCYWDFNLIFQMTLALVFGFAMHDDWSGHETKVLVAWTMQYGFTINLGPSPNQDPYLAAGPSISKVL